LPINFGYPGWAAAFILHGTAEAVEEKSAHLYVRADSFVQQHWRIPAIPSSSISTLEWRHGLTGLIASQIRLDLLELCIVAADFAGGY
jgi:hypothetical protein